MMQLSERSPIPEDVRAAVAWLSARPVGATLVEFVQRLPTEEAEKVHAAALELKRLKAEEQRHMKAARDIQTWSLIGGVGGVLALDVILSGSAAPATVLIIDGLIGAVIWWFAYQAIRQEYSLAGEAMAGRLRVEEGTFERIGVAYRETEDRVRSLAQLAASRRRTQQALRDNQSVLDEIQRGASLAREAGVNSALFDHRRYLLGRILGSLPTEELLEHPDCEQLFREMSRLGLRNHTVEAILLRRTDADLPITARTREIARARMGLVG